MKLLSFITIFSIFGLSLVKSNNTTETVKPPQKYYEISESTVSSHVKLELFSGRDGSKMFYFDSSEPQNEDSRMDILQEWVDTMESSSTMDWNQLLKDLCENLLSKNDRITKEIATVVRDTKTIMDNQLNYDGKYNLVEILGLLIHYDVIAGTPRLEMYLGVDKKYKLYDTSGPVIDPVAIFNEYGLHDPKGRIYNLLFGSSKVELIEKLADMDHLNGFRVAFFSSLDLRNELMVPLSVSQKIPSILGVKWNVIINESDQKASAKLSAMNGIDTIVLVSDDQNQDDDFVRFGIAKWINSQNKTTLERLVLDMSFSENEEAVSRLSNLQIKVLESLTVDSVKKLSASISYGLFPILGMYIFVTADQSSYGRQLYDVYLGPKYRDVLVIHNNHVQDLACFYSSLPYQSVRLSMIKAVYHSKNIVDIDKNSIFHNVTYNDYDRLSDVSCRLTIILSPAQAGLMDMVNLTETCTLLGEAKKDSTKLEVLISYINNNMLGRSVTEMEKPNPGNLRKTCLHGHGLVKTFAEKGLEPTEKQWIEILNDPTTEDMDGVVNEITKKVDKMEHVYNSMTWSSASRIIKEGNLTNKEMNEWIDKVQEGNMCIGRSYTNDKDGNTVDWLTHERLVEEYKKESDPQIRELLKSLMVIVCPFDCSRCPQKK